MIQAHMTPEEILDEVLSDWGRACPGCNAGASVVVEHAEGTGNWAMGKVSCTNCDWSTTVSADLDAVTLDDGREHRGRDLRRDREP